MKLSTFSPAFVAVSFLVGCTNPQSSAEEGATAAVEQGSAAFGGGGNFVRRVCRSSGTHLPNECDEGVSVGSGTVNVEPLEALPRVGGSTGGSPFRARVSIKGPGILDGDGPIELTFETVLEPDSWGTIYGPRFQVLGRTFTSAIHDSSVFPNNPVLDGNRSIKIAMDVMSDGTIGKVALSLTHHEDLDRSTTIGLTVAAESR